MKTFTEYISNINEGSENFNLVKGKNYKIASFETLKKIFDLDSDGIVKKYKKKDLVTSADLSKEVIGFLGDTIKATSRFSLRKDIHGDAISSNMTVDGLKYHQDNGTSIKVFVYTSHDYETDAGDYLVTVPKNIEIK